MVAVLLLLALLLLMLLLLMLLLLVLLLVLLLASESLDCPLVVSFCLFLISYVRSMMRAQ